MDFSKLDGLIPAVVQDAASNEVLMVGFMNEEALARTRQSGFATFFSRTRNTLWTKGETSGNHAEGAAACSSDCDDDTVLLRVDTTRATGTSATPAHRILFLHRALDTIADCPDTHARTRLNGTHDCHDAAAGHSEGVAAGLHRCSSSRSAGFNIYVSSRSYYPTIDDPEIACTLIRAQEMARYVADEAVDAGLTGQSTGSRSTVRPRGTTVVERQPISSTRSRATARCAGCWRCRKDSPYHVAAGPGRRAGFATELVRVTEAYFREARTSTVHVEFSWGATEVKPPDLADAYRRSHRDRVDAARQPTADHRHGARVEPAAHRQPARDRGRGEADEDREHRPAAEGGDRSAGTGRV